MKLNLKLLLASLGCILVFSAVQYDGFYYFLFGAGVSSVVVVLVLLLSIFIKKDTKYYDRNTN